MIASGPEALAPAGLLGSDLVACGGSDVDEGGPGVGAGAVDGGGAFEDAESGGVVVGVAVEGGEVEAGCEGGGAEFGAGPTRVPGLSESRTTDQGPHCATDLGFRLESTNSQVGQIGNPTVSLAGLQQSCLR